MSYSCLLGITRWFVEQVTGEEAERYRRDGDDAVRQDG